MTDIVKYTFSAVVIILASIFFYQALGSEFVVGAESFLVDSDWEDEANIDNLQTDSDIIYTEANQVGTWTSFTQESTNSIVLESTVTGDSRDGVVNVYVKAWEDPADVNGDPDEVFSYLLDGESTTEVFEDVDPYNVYEVEIEIEETSGNSNQRPNVDSVEVLWFPEPNLTLNDLLLFVLLLFAIFLIGKSFT